MQQVTAAHVGIRLDVAVNCLLRVALQTRQDPGLHVMLGSSCDCHTASTEIERQA